MGVTSNYCIFPRIGWQVSQGFEASAYFISSKMDDKRKNTRANPDVPMYTNLPQGGRKNLNKKKGRPKPYMET